MIQIHEQVLRHVRKIRNDRARWSQRGIAGIDGRFVRDFVVGKGENELTLDLKRDASGKVTEFSLNQAGSSEIYKKTQ